MWSAGAAGARPQFAGSSSVKTSSQVLVVRQICQQDRSWINEVVARHFGPGGIVSRDILHEPLCLPGYLAESDRARVGLLLYRPDLESCEVVALIALEPRQGVGTALLRHVQAQARAEGFRRLWLVTTNDNCPAQSLFRKVGWHLVATYPGAVERSRLLKPEIPLKGWGGIPIRDELEYEYPILD